MTQRFKSWLADRKYNALVHMTFLRTWRQWRREHPNDNAVFVYVGAPFERSPFFERAAPAETTWPCNCASCAAAINAGTYATWKQSIEQGGRND